MSDMERDVKNIMNIEHMINNADRAAKLCGAKGGAMEVLYQQKAFPQMLKDLEGFDKDGAFVSNLGGGKGEQMPYRSFVVVVTSAIETFLSAQAYSKEGYVNIINDKRDKEAACELRARVQENMR